MVPWVLPLFYMEGRRKWACSGWLQHFFISITMDFRNHVSWKDKCCLWDLKRIRWDWLQFLIARTECCYITVNTSLHKCLIYIFTYCSRLIFTIFFILQLHKVAGFRPRFYIIHILSQSQQYSQCTFHITLTYWANNTINYWALKGWVLQSDQISSVKVLVPSAAHFLPVFWLYL